jgi:hypothetical protein
MHFGLPLTITSMIGGRIFFSGPEPLLGKNAKVEEITGDEDVLINGLLTLSALKGIGTTGSHPVHGSSHLVCFKRDRHYKSSLSR